ncbi:MAG TPA: ABC transporter ATP-binding protein [Jatrophihabitans sp.]|nr:ABC transporter ATP-binding protein [Jatrophihabitans sp.]
MLTAEQVHLSFGSAPVLAGAELELRESEIVSIMGPSGSGKSTMLACLAGLVRPQSGRVLFQGQDLATLSENRRSALRLRQFGFVFQFGDLVPELTLVENVELPLRFANTKPAAARRQAMEALDLLDIAELADRRSFAISGGELQRAAVARALVHSPAVVFADEPTGALDDANGRVVLDLFLHAAKVRQASIVLATHDPEVAQVATRRFAMREGRLEVQQ